MSDGSYGGARPGAGHPTDAEVEADLADPDSYRSQRARHEKIKADQRELKLSIERGQHLPKVPIEQASATALAVLTQSLRSLPDNLERVCGLTPEQAEKAAEEIDRALLEVSLAFRAMAGE